MSWDMIAARLARIGISKVMIGTGREIVRTTILGFPWVITSNPMGAITSLTESREIS
jgi:hypothetical protein